MNNIEFMRVNMEEDETILLSSENPNAVIFNTLTGCIYVEGVVFGTPGQETPVGHSLTLFIPSHIVGTSGTVYVMYDGELVMATLTADTPDIIFTPENQDLRTRFAFTQGGIVVITASYAGLDTSRSTALEYSEGTTQETTIDNSGDHPVETTTTTDTDNNQITETTEYIDGEEVKTGYEITPGSEEINVQDGLDTGIHAFDGTNGFDIYFKFRATRDMQPPEGYTPNTGDKSGSYMYTILNLKQEVDPYPGMCIRMSEKGNKLDIRITPTDPEDPTRVLDKSTSINQTDDGIYYLRIKYDPSRTLEQFAVQNLLTNRNIISLNCEFSNDIDATIGYVLNPSGQKVRQCNLDVLEFKINKILVAEESDQPTVQDISTWDNGLVVTREKTADDEYKSLTIEADDYVKVDQPILTSLTPFAEPQKAWRMEMDARIDYDDQPDRSKSNMYWNIISMLLEENPWPGLVIRLRTIGMPEKNEETEYSDYGYIEHYLVHKNPADETSRITSTSKYAIREDKVHHFTITYDPQSVYKVITIYDHTTGEYLNWYNNAARDYHVKPHNEILTLGCGVQDGVPFRPAIFWLRKFRFEYLD